MTVANHLDKGEAFLTSGYSSRQIHQRSSHAGYLKNSGFLLGRYRLELGVK